MEPAARRSAPRAGAPLLRRLARSESPDRSAKSGRPAAGAGRREGLAWLAEFALVEDLAGFRDVELSARVALNTLQVVHRRARRIVDLPCISADPAVSVGGRILDELLEGKVVLVDVSGLGGTEEVLVASYLTRRVLEEWQGAFLDDPERHKTTACRGCRSGGSTKSAVGEQGPGVERVPPGGAGRGASSASGCWP